MAVTEVTNYDSFYADYGKQTDKTGRDSVSADKRGEKPVLEQMQDKYADFKVTAGDFSQKQVSAQRKGFQGVAVSRAYLAKAENDERTAKDLDQMLGGVESAQKWLRSAFKRDGMELVSCGYYIDENGNMGSWSLVRKKDSMLDGMAEQSEKDAGRIREKREKTKEQKKAEDKKEKQINLPKNEVFVMASSNRELLEKAKEAVMEKKEEMRTKEEKALGQSVDYRI